MAVVYRAFDTLLERQVALKLLHPHLAREKESRARFRREAQSVARLNHPNVLEIHDYRGLEDSDEVFIVMELVEGTTLRLFLDQAEAGKIPAPAAALILHRVALALSSAHQQGIVHRDVKPENILIGADGVPKLSDFGIAHLMGRSDMTHTGQVLGSPSYMSPEHIERSVLDARADIFSVGSVLYELVTGKAPFPGKNPHAVIKQIIEGKFVDPASRTPSVGRGVAEIIRKCLKVCPEERYQNAAALAVDLEAVVANLGIDPSDETLKGFFADPKSWAVKTRPKIVSATLSLASAARKAGSYAEAAEHFNCVLALEPGNPEAMNALVGMHRARSLRKVAERVAMALPLVAVFVAGIWWSLLDRSESSSRAANAILQREAQPEFETLLEDPDTELAETADGSAPTALEPPETQVPNAIHRKETDTPSPRASASAKSAVGQRRLVVFTPHPLAVRITIDGKERFDFGPANRSRQLPVGKHTLTFTPLDTRRFLEHTRIVDVSPGKEAFYVKERLKLRPGTLLVKSNVETEVTVPGHKGGRTNKAFEISLADEFERSVSILVSARGYASQTRQVTISAGEQTTVTVMLGRAEEADAGTSTPHG